MNPDLEKLVRLHRAEAELRRAEAELGEVPHFRQELEARLARDRGRLENVRSALEASQKGRRQHEAVVQDLEVKRSKYRGQLMEVKTNKEYTAMLHEIEAVEREIRGREDQILEEMERADALVEDLRREEATFRTVEERAQVEARELGERETLLRERAERLARERDEVAASVPAPPLGLYRKVARLRGTGVSEAKDGMCQTCHVKLRLQVWVDLRRNDSLLQCEACSRILYYEPPAPVVASEP